MLYDRFSSQLKCDFDSRHTASTCSIGVVEPELVRQEHYDGPDYFPNGGGGGGGDIVVRGGGSGVGGGGEAVTAPGDLGRETPFVPVASPTTERGQRQSDIDANQIGVSEVREGKQGSELEVV